MKRWTAVLIVSILFIVGVPALGAFGAQQQYMSFFPGNKSCGEVLKDMALAQKADQRDKKKKIIGQKDLVIFMKRSEERSWMHGYITAINFLRVSRGNKNFITRLDADVRFENMVLGYCKSHSGDNLAKGTASTISNIFAQIKKKNQAKK